MFADSYNETMSDDVTGKGVYIHPGVWHNAVYTHPQHGERRTFFNRQGKVHARVSVNWADEFGVLMQVPLLEPTDLAKL